MSNLLRMVNSFHSYSPFPRKYIYSVCTYGSLIETPLQKNRNFSLGPKSKLTISVWLFSWKSIQWIFIFLWKKKIHRQRSTHEFFSFNQYVRYGEDGKKRNFRTIRPIVQKIWDLGKFSRNAPYENTLGLISEIIKSLMVSFLLKNDRISKPFWENSKFIYTAKGPSLQWFLKQKEKKNK